ncbi:MAG: ribonuclease HIII [Simkaniaceae bacterium]|nr:ribonuclease HIII [Simkaniaceae bacterium]
MNPKKPTCFVASIEKTLFKKMEKELEEQGFVFSKPQYTEFQAKKKGVVCTLYKSGKITVQGAGKDDFITYYLEPEILKTFSYSYPLQDLDFTPRIGVDEAGKGDFFGPLCVGALYADKKGIQTLIEMGVCDSKKMKDTKICLLAKKIKEQFDYHLIQLNPSKYNELYSKFNNLNSLLAWGHASAIETVSKKTSCKNVIIDQFANESVVLLALKKKNLELDLTQRHRGEEDIIVAGASILARACFVEGIQRLGDTYSTILPKGASKAVIASGKKLVDKYGPNILMELGKLHFKTKEQILN